MTHSYHYTKLPYIGDTCPICQSPMRQNHNAVKEIIDYSCNNEKEIIFAKARREPVPRYHSFSYTKHLSNADGLHGFTIGDISDVIINLSVGKKVCRVMLMHKNQITHVTDRYGKLILTLDHVFEPDFPNLDKLSNRVATCINFS